MCAYIRTDYISGRQSVCRTQISLSIRPFPSLTSPLPSPGCLISIPWQESPAASLPCCQLFRLLRPQAPAGIPPSLRQLGSNLFTPEPCSTGHGGREGLLQTRPWPSPAPAPAGLCLLTPGPLLGADHTPPPLLSLCHAETHRSLCQ